MRKVVLLLLLIATTSASFSQQTTSNPSITKDVYLKKSKTQKTIGWSLLSAGAVTWMVGISQAANGSNDDDGGNTALAVGTAMGIGGVTFLILGGINKKKAMSLSLQQQDVPYLQKNSIVHQKIPALSMRLNF
jgi:predicted ribosomally synthesized peptide with SipW-like signal peptide